MTVKKKKWKKISKIAIIAVVAVLLCVFVFFRKTEGTGSYSGSMQEFYESSYQDYLNEKGFQGVMSANKVSVDINSFEVKDGMTAEWDGNGVATSEKGSITWQFNVEEEGFYNIGVTYRPLPGTGSQINRVIYLDDEICYS